MLTPDIKQDIVNPAVRHITVADPARSAAFYRDVLGFEIVSRDGQTEAVRGPARVVFGGPESGGPCVLFFETAGLDALRGRIAASSGKPSEIARVNWIKQRVFEVRDPDGHTLWFGDSFHQPERDNPAGIRQALPELPYDNVAAAVDYYREILGFRINYQQDDLGVMDRDAITLLLIERGGQHKGVGSCSFYVENADALHAEFTAKGANVQGPPVSHPWGLRDFRVLDCEGNRLTFAQTFE